MHLALSARRRPWWAAAAIMAAFLSSSLLGVILVSSLALLGPILSACLLVVSVTAQDKLDLPGALRMTQAAVVASGLSLGLAMLARPQRPIPQQRSLLLWGLFLGILLLAAAFSPYAPLEGLKELWRWSAAAMTWLILVIFIQRPWQRIVVAISLLLGPLINALLGLVQFLTGDGPPSFEIAGRFVRAYGTYGQPNSFAGYLNHAWPLALALAVGSSVVLLSHRNVKNPQLSSSLAGVRDQGPGSRRSVASHSALLASQGVKRSALRYRTPGLQSAIRCLLPFTLWLVTGTLLAALLASFSRGAWLGAALGLLLMMLVQGGRLRWLGIIGLLCVVSIIALGGTSLLPEALASRLESITRAFRFFDPGTVQVTDQNFAVVERMAQVWAGWKMAISYPLLGIGPGNYSLAYPDYAVAPWFASRGHAHNYYIHLAAEAGIPGLLAYLALLGSVCYSIMGSLKKPQLGILERSMLIGSCGMIAAIAGHSLFENLHVLHMPIQMAATWALAQSFSGESDSQTARQSDFSP